MHVEEICKEMSVSHPSEEQIPEQDIGMSVGMDETLPKEFLHSSAECKEPKSKAAEYLESLDVGEWRASKVHREEICKAIPASHPSDKGTLVQEIRVSTWNSEVDNKEARDERCKIKEKCCRQQRRQEDIRKELPQKTVRSRMIRLPSVRDRKQASKRNQTYVYAVKNAGDSYVVTNKQQARVRVKNGSIRLFDEFETLSRNIKKAKNWILQEVQWNAKAEVFTPESQQVGSNRQQEGLGCKAPKASECRVEKSANRILPESFSRIKLQEVLQRHKQVSHMSSVSSSVRSKMNSYCSCTPGRMVLDLKGRMAAQVQRDLRSQLVQDLKEGNDEAAFICKQLGIDSVPRADQLELMVAAMPGVEKIIFEGTEMKSGLDIEYWMKMHATHCKKGCTATCINPDCYFRIVHHFLLRGFDPVLKDGQSWDQFETKLEAYVNAWSQDAARCGTAWEKWKQHSGDFLSKPSTTKPKLVVPLLPASRSKHVWRYLKHGIPYKVRLCLDLKAVGVNEATEDWKFRYRGLYEVASKLKKNDWLAAVDISRFYLRLPAGPNLQRVQWVQDPETYAKSAKANANKKRKWWRQLMAIGFGLKTAPAWASVVSAELVRILEANGIRVVGCFLDDILIAGDSKQECKEALEKARQIMQQLGIPSNEKTVGPKSPSEGIVFLGVYIQTNEMRFSISEEHRMYAIDRIESVLEARKATKGDLASIAGVLTWISFVFTPGRSRRQPIYDAARLGSSGHKSDVVVIKGELQRLLKWWHSTLTAADFVGTRVWDSQFSPDTVLLHTDASGEDGWGGCIGHLHFVGPWSKELADESMLFKEMVPVMIIVAILAPAVAETVFGIAVDNTGVAFSVNKLCCKDTKTLRLIQQFASDLDAYGHTALGAHVRRERNTHADELSHALFPAMWQRIIKHQNTSSRSTRIKESYWSFPFVAHCMKTDKCFSACFRMRKSLYARRTDVQ